MKNSNSIEDIAKSINETCRGRRDLVLIGGCSRVGKTTFSLQLKSKLESIGSIVTVINLDSWLISASLRPLQTSVLERYDLSQIKLSMSALLDGQEIAVPCYDLRSRERDLGRETRLSVDSGIILIEGVIALANTELRKLAALSIYIHEKDAVRVQRLLDFYINEKSFTEERAKKLITEREQEEVFFIQQTQKYADIIFTKL